MRHSDAGDKAYLVLTLGISTRSVVPWAGLRPMMSRVGRGRAACIFDNTGHGHLGWTLSAVTADMVAGVVEQALGTVPAVVPGASLGLGGA